MVIVGLITYFSYRSPVSEDNRGMVVKSRGKRAAAEEAKEAAAVAEA